MAGLREYRSKRDFTKTAEPAGDGRAGQPRPAGLLCVQKHAARQLHWDLRLELDGVLKSWAVPKGPSYDPTVRRLAVQVEDHPVEYGDFEGAIPKGEYGGGTVMLWDTGTWEPVGEPHEGLEKGELKVRLEGEKLRGGWVLVRTRSSDDDERGAPQWLLIKERDREARPGEPDHWGPDDRSVSSGRTMDEIAAGTQPRSSAARGPTPGLPATVPLSLATLVQEPPDGEDWLHEVKYDGYRIAARVDGGDVRLFSRNGKDWTERFTPVAVALAGLGVGGVWLDGEMVVFDRHGVSDFHALQGSLKAGRPPAVTYVVFDLLFEAGEDLRALPLRERKARLERLLAPHRTALHGLVRFGDHIEGGGEDVFAEACRRRLEGVVSKRAGDGYAGRRTHSWLKAKCGRRQEFVVGGYTEPAGARVGLGALLVGVHDGGGLRYSGRVGSGFDDATLKRLTPRLAARERPDPPFVDPPRGAAARGVHWVEPALVAEVAFAEWTSDHQLRQPVFKGLRDDKSPADVVREATDRGGDPADGTAGPQANGAARAGRSKERPKRASGAAPAKARRPAATAAEHAGKPAGGPAPDDEKPAGEPAKGARRAGADVGGVRITHPDRVVFPESGLTKLDVARYYETVAGLMVPYLARRPLTVIRCPDGVAQECFFQKHVTPSVPRNVSRTTVRAAGGGTDVYPVVDTPEALLAMVQNGAVEFHVWGSRTESIERPDVLVFDLDPGPDVTWARVREAARALRAELAQRGLQSFLKTSGGKGLHIVVPVRPGPAEWPRVGAWAREVVEALVAREPERYTATMSKAKRAGKVFVDHFRNGRGATSAAPYSLRARPGAPVSLPITWDELTRTSGGGAWTMEKALRRLRRRTADPWQDFWEAGAGQEVPET